MSELCKLLEELTLPLGGESDLLARAIGEIEELWAKVERLEAKERQQPEIELKRAAAVRALILEVMDEHLITKEEALTALRERGGS